MENLAGFKSEELICSTPLLSNSLIDIENNNHINNNKSEVDSIVVVRKKNNQLYFRDLVIDLESKKVELTREESMQKETSSNKSNVSFSREETDANLSRSFVERFFARELNSPKQNGSTGSINVSENENTLTDNVNGDLGKEKLGDEATVSKK